MKKKIIIFFVLLVILALLIYFYFNTRAQKPSANAADDTLNYAIIDNIQKQTSFYTPPLLSWNTKKYGRIYAEICVAHKNLYPSSCQKCFDGGTTFYNREGENIGSCWSQASDQMKTGYSCDILSELSYKEADYISEEAYKTCPEL